MNYGEKTKATQFLKLTNSKNNVVFVVTKNKFNVAFNFFYFLALKRAVFKEDLLREQVLKMPTISPHTCCQALLN
jgi:hypothetical protein